MSRPVAPRASLLALLLTAAVAVPTARADDWPTFRGAARTGVAPDTNLLEKWPEGGPKLLWKAEGAGRGYASPAIAGNRLYTLGDGLSTAGDKDEYLSCFDRATGKQIWRCPQEGCRGAGHSSIVISTVGGRKVYVQTTASGACGVDAATGKLLWSYPIDQTTAVIPTPIVRGDLVFFSAGYRRGGALLKQVATGDGVKMEEVYGLIQDLANKHGGIVLVGDHLYGDSDDQGIPFCAELATGKQAWKSRGSGKGSAAVTAADGHVYFRYQDGTLALVKADPKGFEEVSTFKIPDSDARPSWAHPVILDGRLYLREQDAILCYDITAG